MKSKNDRSDMAAWVESHELFKALAASRGTCWAALGG